MSPGLTVLVYLNHLEIGGTQIPAVEFASSLRERGIGSVLVGARDTIPRDGPSIVDLAERRGITVELLDDVGRLSAAARALSAVARTHRADLVHVYGSWGGGAGAAYWGPARFGRIPWVQTVYEMSVPPLIKKHMPLIVGTGYQLDEQAARPGPTALISPPVDMRADSPDYDGGREFRARHGGDDGVLLVIVSRLDPNMKAYSIGVAIDAMRTIGAAGGRLVIVGDGPSRDDLQRRAARVNADVGREVVTLVGALLDPRPAYAAADIMLGMGGSAARSLAFGKPLVVQGEAGWSQLFEPGTAQALARSSYWSPETVTDPVALLVAQVSPLLSDRRRRADLGVFGREFAAGRFGLTAMTDRLVEVYGNALRLYRWRAWAADLPSEVRRVAAALGRRIAALGSGGRHGRP